MAAVASSAVTAASPPAGAYEELRRELDLLTDDGETAVYFGAGPKGGSRTPDPDYRARIEALCGNDVAYWREVGDHLAQHTRPPQGGKRLSAAKFAEVLSNQLQTVSQTLPGAGQARFLRPGETLRSRSADLAMAIRQRAEWVAVLNKITLDLDQARIAKPGDFRASFSLSTWTKLKCDLVRHSDDLVGRQLAAGYPSEADGVDTESAFLLLVGATRDKALAGRALAAARGRDPAVAAPAVAALQRWSADN